MHSSQWVVCIKRVVESDCRPVTGVVTGIASSRKGCGNVIWIRRSSEICLVAAVAGGRQARVVVVRVALGAGHGGMSSGQREDRCMIKAGWTPRAGCMTQSAIRGEARSYVIRIRRPREVGLVAAIAGGRQSRVVVVDMALRARHAHVRSRQRERSGVVIERGLGPGSRVMARFAGRGET